MNIKPIKNQRDYERALRRVESLWKSPEGSPEGDELDVLATLLEAYEREHYPIDVPDPVEAIKFRLEQQGKDSRALIGVIGQRTRVYEVMRGKRSLSLNMIRGLHDKFGIPANVLIQPGHKQGRSTGRHTPRRLSRAGLKKSAQRIEE
jgi:HTH-type transcriptional regulator/antitoxin HigA